MGNGTFKNNNREPANNGGGFGNYVGEPVKNALSYLNYDI